MVPLAVYFIGSTSMQMPELVQHLVLTISAVMGIHLLDRIYLLKDTQEALGNLIGNVRSDITSQTNSLGAIRHDISDQTNSLIKTSKSLEAMDRCGIVQVYPGRAAAADDMRGDLSNPANSQVRLIGISLNDFIQEMDRSLTAGWRALEGFVRGQRHIDNPERGLDIRILLIDPRSFGARLRSAAESQEARALSGRLEMDVDAAAKYLRKLELYARPEDTHVSFECRLYRLPPILFLCIVDSACYVQQYHFWSSRDNSAPMPLLKFRRLEDAGSAIYPYHREMEFHFDWIWKHASVPVAEYVEAEAVGTDDGIHRCGAANVYMDSAEASTRIVDLLKRARDHVSIQGVSLHSFFVPGGLREAISSVLEEENADVEVLLLDPDCEQAKFRSFRERLLMSADEDLADYLGRGEHHRSELYHDTQRTLEHLRHMIEDIRGRRGSDWKPRLKVALYTSAPACFLLRIDDCVLVEQYHYGKIARHQRAILGKDMPLVEYAKSPHQLYAGESDPLRRPFDLLVNHFEYAMAQAADAGVVRPR